MKKLISVLLMLCLLLSSVSGALAAYDGSKPACQKEGHAKWDGNDHNRPQSCWVKGHFNCDGMDHSRASCGIWGHFNCDGKEHVPAVCGDETHFACKGEHAAAGCGKENHCEFDGLKHVPAVCGVDGHYACEKGHTTTVISKYCIAEPQHKKCEKEAAHTCDPANGGCGVTYPCEESNEHTICRMCGLLWCDESLGGHDTPCGYAEHRPCVYTLAGKEWNASAHPLCGLCGKGKCAGKHGAGVCADICDQCGEVRIKGESHRAKCGEHFLCVSKGRDHGWCDKCGQLKCRGESKKHVCGK